jgi:hypothetical protein
MSAAFPAERQEHRPVSSDRLPENIGRYRLLSRLGAGGMGRVFLALDGEGRTVAIKQLHPSLAFQPGMRERLRREVAVMHQVRSGRVAEILDSDLDSDPPYIVTRYVQGRTLDDVVADQGPLPLPALTRVARGLAEALGAIHGAGHVHRDLKPANVMLVEGEPVVIDFGVARVEDATRITQTGGVIGSPGYIAPEALNGAAAGPEFDVFSWGATIAYAATGRPAFGTGTPPAVMYRTTHDEPDLDGVPDELRPLVVAALAKSPRDRPDAPSLIRETGGVVPGLGASPGLVPPLREPTVHGPREDAVAHGTPVPSPPRGGRGPVPKKIRVAAGAAIVTVAAAVLIAVYALPGDGRRPQASTKPSRTPSAQPAGQVPRYSETIGDFGPAVKFRQFLEDHVKQEVRIVARLGGEVAPRLAGGKFNDAGGNTDPYLFLWGNCTEPLQTGESPTLDKCDAVEVQIDGTEKPGRPGLSWAHSMYTLAGNFRVDGGVMHQGVVGFTLIPVT